MFLSLFSLIYWSSLIPYPLYCGSSIGVDNGNIGFILLSIILFPLIDWIAGFITEYSSIYFSLILLTEYANIIGMSFWMIILFSIFPLSLLLVLFFVCLIRSTLNRLKFDELMTNAWIVLLPILFYVLFISLLY